MKHLLFAVPLLLAACTTSEPGIRVERVEVPVPVSCVPLEAIPAEPEPVGHKLTGNPAIDLGTVAASALELRAWGRTMHGALVACAG